MKLIISNLKMNMTLPEVIEYEQELSKVNSTNEIVVCPSYPFISYFKNNNYKVGSQNVSEVVEGSLTGEVSAKQLKSLNVKYTIVGHSERHKYLSETNEQVSKKVNILLKNDIIPVICIGEDTSLANNVETIEKELIEILDNVDNISNTIIAYEPVWAIGTGVIPDIDSIKRTIKYIKNLIINRYNAKVKVLYGGSVNPTNIDLLNEIEEIDGYLLGEASLDIKKFKEIVEKMEVI